MSALSIFGAFLVLGLSTGSAAELHVLTSAALTEVSHELIPEFERTTHIKVVESFGGNDIPMRLDRGEATAHIGTTSLRAGDRMLEAVARRAATRTRNAHRFA